MLLRARIKGLLDLLSWRHSIGKQNAGSLPCTVMPVASVVHHRKHSLSRRFCLPVAPKLSGKPTAAACIALTMAPAL